MHFARPCSKLLLCVASGILTVLPATGSAQVPADLFIRDRPDDTGVEPYTGSGPLYASEDIWVRRDPDPNYSSMPFPTASPTWTPLPHQNPEYREPNTGRPNYIYVRVTNRGEGESEGTERLRVYQAKASTGLAWPAQWVDYMDNACGASTLYGIEVTKPRRNAQLVSQAERDAYRDALLALNTDPSLQYADGVQYWRKQNDIHSGIGNPEHGNPAFLPWHREMVNRFENLLKEADPLVTLLYWDFTSDPRFGAANLFSADFMGANSGTVAAPLVPLRPPTLSRDVAAFAFTPDSDSTLAAAPDYGALRFDVESSPNHNSAHGFIGGPFGQISFLSTAVADPFFFQLHGNVDRLWANWQRNPSEPGRVDRVAAYGPEAGNARINATMSPWDGDTGLAPWDTAPTDKTSHDRSVIYPPIYETAPLNIPVLGPGESVIVEIPWYPPNIADFGCFGDSGHFCLLSRIETETTAPFGMTFPEGSNVSTNTANNNNIAWKNVTVVDETPDLIAGSLLLTTGVLVRNVFEREAEFALWLRDGTPRGEGEVFEIGRIGLTLPPELTDRVLSRNRDFRGIEVATDPDTGEPIFLALRTDAELVVPLRPGEIVPVGVRAEFPTDLPAERRADPFIVDIEQGFVQPGGQFVRLDERARMVGGLRFTIDLSSIKLIEQGSEWLTDPGPRALSSGDLPDGRELRAVDLPLAEPAGNDPVRTFVKTFTVGDPGVLESLRLVVTGADGFTVTLNGEEVFRRNLPDGPLSDEAAPLAEPTNLEANREWVADLDPALLREGQNVIAALVAARPGGEIAFDLGLTANDARRGADPDVALRAGDAGKKVFAPGEPIPITLFAGDQDGGLEQVTLSLDGRVMARSNQGEFQDEVRIEEPGLHTFSAIAVDDEGRRTERQLRLVVAKAIPPNVVIASPEVETQATAGEPIEVFVEAEPSFARSIDRVTLHAKLGDEIATGLDLVQEGNYPAVDETAEAPYRLSFTPDRPGMYMLQAGAVDDHGTVGVSRHVHVNVQ